MMRWLVPRDSYTGLLTGPVAWFAFFLVAYLITGSGCTLTFADGTIFGINVLRVLVLLAGLLTAVIIVLAGVQAWRQWRVAYGDTESEMARHHFVDLVALLLSGASLIGTLWLMVTVVINPVC